MSTDTATSANILAEEGESYWRYVKKQFKKNTFAVIGVYIVTLFALVAVFADFLANEKPLVCSYQNEVLFPIATEYGVSLGISEWDANLQSIDWKNATYEWSIFPPVPYSPSTTDKTIYSIRDRAPSGRHLLGTDEIGRDTLAGLIHGTRYALLIGFVAMGIALSIGVVLGAIAGYRGGIVDIAISRMIELVMTLPTFFLIITITAMVQDGSIWLIMMMIGLTGWTSIARFTRGEVLRVRSLDYVSAATALGYSTRRIIFRHILPNALAPVLVTAAFGIAGAVLIESALSFLGFGVPPTVVTWGSTLSKARMNPSAWWLAIFPGLMIFLTVLSYNLIGDALRDATDPRLRN